MAEPRAPWLDAAAQRLSSHQGTEIYNGWRPTTPSMLLEDDGVALRLWGWIDWLLGVERHFVWDVCHYQPDGAQRDGGAFAATDVWRDPATFRAGYPKRDPVLGVQYVHGDGSLGVRNNGDGLLIYPGQDVVYPESSLGVAAPVPSLRLKMWRAGLDDRRLLDLSVSRGVPRDKLVAIARRIVGREVAWERDRTEPGTLVGGPLWETDPAKVEAARQEVLELLQSLVPPPGPTPEPAPGPTPTPPAVRPDVARLCREVSTAIRGVADAIERFGVEVGSGRGAVGSEEGYRRAVADLSGFIEEMIHAPIGQNEPARRALKALCHDMQIEWRS